MTGVKTSLKQRPPAGASVSSQLVADAVLPFVRWWSCLVVAAIVATGIVLPIIVHKGLSRAEARNLQDQLEMTARGEAQNVQDTFKHILHSTENIRIALNLAPEGGLSYQQFNESLMLLKRPSDSSMTFIWVPLMTSEKRSAFESHVRAINANSGQYSNFSILDVVMSPPPPSSTPPRFDPMTQLNTTPAASGRSLYLPLLYAWSADGRLLVDDSFIGTDMLLSPAVDNLPHSIESGEPNLVTNLIFAGDRLTRGTLLLVPVYRGVATPTTAEGRRAAAIGFLGVAAGASRTIDCGRDRMYNGSLRISIFDEHGLVYCGTDDCVAAGRLPANPAGVASVHGARFETTITIWGKGFPFVAVPTNALVESVTSSSPVVFAVLTGLGCAVLLAGAIVAIRAIVLTQQRMDTSERQRRRVTDMIGFVNHELRNPLNAIMGLIDHATCATEDIVAASALGKGNSTSAPVAVGTATSGAVQENSSSKSAARRAPARPRSNSAGPLTRTKSSTGAVTVTSAAEKMSSILQDLRDTGQMCSLMKHIIDDVLDIRRLEERGLKIVSGPVSLSRLLEDVMAIVQPKLSEKPTLSLEMRSFDSDAVFRTDSVRVKQLLLNLVVNAIKYSDKGVIRVSVELVDGAGIDTAAGQRIRFTVQDNGKAIEDSKKKYLFQPFMQLNGSARHQGVGLGLYLCSMLVDIMGGDIGFESTVGVGSIFWFELPYEATTMGDVDLCTCDDGASESSECDHEERRRTAATANNNNDYQDGHHVHCEPESVTVTVAVDVEGLQHESVALNMAGDYMDVARDAAKGLAIDMPLCGCAEYISEIRMEALPSTKPPASAQPVQTTPVPRAHSDSNNARLRSAPSTPDNQSTVNGSLRQTTTRVTAGPTVPATVTPRRHLVCDDLAVNRVILKRYIQSSFPGDLVDEAENGLVAVALAEVTVYDLVWMDVQMPVMDGIEATKRILGTSRCSPHPAIIGITGDITAEEVAHYHSVGMHDVYGKPVTRGNIVEIVRKWCQRRT